MERILFIKDPLDDLGYTVNAIINALNQLYASNFESNRSLIALAGALAQQPESTRQKLYMDFMDQIETLVRVANPDSKRSLADDTDALAKTIGFVLKHGRVDRQTAG